MSNKAIQIHPSTQVEIKEQPSPTTYQLQTNTIIFDPFSSNTPPSEFRNRLKDRMRVYFTTEGESQ